MSNRECAPETFRREIVPGIWEDTDGAHHFDVPAILTFLGIPDTAENRELATRLFAQELRRAGAPKVIERL